VKNYISEQQNPGKLVWSGSGGKDAKSTLQQIMVSVQWKMTLAWKESILNFPIKKHLTTTSKQKIRGNERPSASTRRVVAYLVLQDLF